MCGHRGKAQANVPLGTGKENATERSAMGPDKHQKVFDRHETSDPADTVAFGAPGLRPPAFRLSFPCPKTSKVELRLILGPNRDLK